MVWLNVVWLLVYDGVTDSYVDLELNHVYCGCINVVVMLFVKKRYILEFKNDNWILVVYGDKFDDLWLIVWGNLFKVSKFI